MNKPVFAKRVLKDGQENGWKKWSKKEEEELLEEIEEFNIEEIAKLHKRTNGGISSRLCVIAARLLEEDKSLEDVLKITKVTEEDLDKYIAKIGKKKTNKKKDEKNDNDEPKVYKGQEAEILKLKLQLSRIEEKFDLIMEKLEIS